MSYKHVIRCVPRWTSLQRQPKSFWSQGRARGVRFLHHDGRNRLSNIWTPTTLVKTPNNQPASHSSSHDLLVRAGFLRQAHSGIFHLLPLGLRVQNKLEALLDKHMMRLGASKVSLSSLSSEQLWQRSGRLEGRDSEFFRLQDRKNAKYLLSPTHEEEITTIVANAVNSYQDLPLRLYQVSRKYRDEARPRQGLLRGREFLMKDLYTFDLTERQAIATYEEVRKAYRAFLDELKLPYLVANADSGNMGGTLSHEYHFVSANGEDSIVACKNCEYAVNEEVFLSTWTGADDKVGQVEHLDNYVISKDRTRLYRFVIPARSGALNLHVVKRLVPEVDTSVDDALSVGAQQGGMLASGDDVVTTFFDPRCQSPDAPGQSPSLDGKAVLLSMTQENDVCPGCSQPSLTTTKAVEIGHTFHLSTRYSEPLGASALDANNKQVPIQMGCHGIGVSRLIAAISGLLADDRGLNWPLAVAPFQAVMLAAPKVQSEDVHEAYDALTSDLKGSLTSMDIVIDDRPRQLGWKLNDADLIGYPFILLLGRHWASERKLELQCRRLGVKEDIAFDDVPARLRELSAAL